MAPLNQWQPSISDNQMSFSVAETIVPNDDSAFEKTTDAIIFSVPGALRVEFESGDPVTLSSLTAGQVYYFRLKKVYATETTADNIIALYR